MQQPADAGSTAQSPGADPALLRLERIRRTVAGLTSFLDWLITTSQHCGLSRNTLIQIRSSWRTVRDELALPADQGFDTVAPEALMEQVTIVRGKTMVSNATCITRLRRAFEIHRAWLDGDPGWDTKLRVSRKTASGTYVTRLPLRPGMDIAIELPHDLTVAEAHLLSTWLATRARG
ncbi:hypothetical protein [Phytohabitans kaempferiae]|uniref:Core-binding (CB) domain-containing protein n=1 Tax=Phytohabitans kaempferiae TaxID=1620943 RepID=A0ABV6MCM0_9ACTN